jgi:branched-subunit amino acid aminotransferase/4-amino-4-deoxychorismate lyase
MMRRREIVSVSRARAIRPFPSLNGWIMTRLRCAIAPRTSGSASQSSRRLSASSSMRLGMRPALGAVLAWALGKVVGQHHVVHASDRRIVDLEVWIGGHLQDIAERLAVASRLRPRVLVGAQRLVVVQGRDRIVLGYDVPLIWTHVEQPASRAIRVDPAVVTVGIVSDAPIRVEVDGRTATAEQLTHPALVNYGHYTAMQVRDGRTRGLALHLDRLDAATQELFDAGIDHDLVRDHIRHALGEVRDASVRVSVFRPERNDTASVLVAVRPPVEPPSLPQALTSVPYQRPVPHIKHAGSFAQIYYGRRAVQHGFDDALLTGPGGVISEAGISNLAVHDGTAVVWPDAPCLAGITMQLLLPRLPGAGIPTRRAPVHLADVPSIAAAFVTNSHGVAPVGRIDDTAIPVDPDLVKTVTGVYESVDWDPI